tara:strand:+ start:663 stop:1538 length:876 start_codon:yes stop_codon:yes gene_type:complete
MITLKYFTQTLLIIFSITISSCDKETEDSTPEVIDTITPSLRTQTIFISQTIEGEIESRAVIIQTPAVIDFNKKYPLVFAFHGRGGSNTSWVNKLSSFTNSGEFVGIYPQGFLESWNLGTEPSKADDVAFVNLIIEELEKFNNLDFDRMYAIGTSNGSGMVNKLGIETTHFKAIAPIVSQLMESSPLLPTTQPISVYQINGAADTIIPIEGGPKLGHVFLDANESAALWANHFDCNQNPEIQTLGEDTLSIYTACNNGKEIRYLRVENGAHNLHWGNPSLLDDVWIFFQRF